VASNTTSRVGRSEQGRAGLASVTLLSQAATPSSRNTSAAAIWMAASTATASG